MKKVILSLLATAVAAGVANAQDNETAPLTLSGSVDTYYRTTLNTKDNGPLAAPSTSYSNGTGFNIGMINIAASKEGEKSGFVADLFFGPRATDDLKTGTSGYAGGAVEPFAENVNQLFAYWNATDKLTFTVGRWNTYLGYELISPTGNYNYSTSYLFTNGPFSQTGLKASYAITDALSFTGALMDNLDNAGALGKSQNNLMYGGQLGYSVDKASVYLNYLGGNTGLDGAGDTTGNLRQVDLTTVITATDKLSLGLNASYRSVTGDKKSDIKGLKEAGFAGLALYAQYAINDNFSFGFRGERFSSRQGYIADGNFNNKLLTKGDAKDLRVRAAVTALTLSANYKVGDLTFIPEIRVDMYANTTKDDKEVLADTQNKLLPDSDGSFKKAISSFGIAAVYAF